MLLRRESSAPPVRSTVRYRGNAATMIDQDQHPEPHPPPSGSAEDSASSPARDSSGRLMVSPRRRSRQPCSRARLARRGQSSAPRVCSTNTSSRLSDLDQEPVHAAGRRALDVLPQDVVLASVAGALEPVRAGAERDLAPEVRALLVQRDDLTGGDVSRTALRGIPDAPSVRSRSPVRRRPRRPRRTRGSG